jgi:hypothetical protein
VNVNASGLKELLQLVLERLQLLMLDLAGLIALFPQILPLRFTQFGFLIPAQIVFRVAVEAAVIRSNSALA